MKSHRKTTYLSYDEIARRLDGMVEAIREEEFSSIVVIVRGGTFPAVHLSVRTGLPLYYLKYDRSAKENKVSWIGSCPPKEKVLLCEDVAGSGQTLIDCRKFMENQGYPLKAVVVWKDTYSASTPEFICYETNDPNETVMVPWEKFKLNPASETNWIDKQDHDFEFTGWDMDGIFLEDVPGRIYDVGLEHALAIRDQYPASSYMPKTKPNDVIITGRPLSDEHRTKAWLKNNNIHRAVFFRDDGVEFPTAESTALWKGKKALEVGCSRYVESDARQAMFLAKMFPQIEIVWWNEGNPITLKASEFSYGTRLSS